MTKVYLIHAIGDIGKDHYYYLYDSEEKADIAYDFISGDAQDKFEEEWDAKIESGEINDSYDFEAEYENASDKAVEEDSLGCWDSISALHKHLKRNDMEIAEEYECYMC